MSLITVTDPGGKTFTFLEVNGTRYPDKIFTEEIIRNVPNIKMRDDDVIVTSYPKSGTHWIWETCCTLVQGRISNTTRPMAMLELRHASIIDNMPSPRVFNTHNNIEDFPEDIANRPVKIVHVLRNPKDVAVSYYNHTINMTQYHTYSGEFKDYMSLFVQGNVPYGSWFEHVLAWEKTIQTRTDLNIYELSYEEMKLDPITGIRKLAEFLECRRDEEFIKEVADFCSFKPMAERKAKIHGLNKDGKPRMYRKGIIGDWKNWFTVAQNEWFDEIYREKMKNSELKFCYSSGEQPR